MFGRLATKKHDKTDAFIRSHRDRLDPKASQVGYTCEVRFTATEIADIVGGVLVGPDRPIETVSIDSRSMEPGGLFVPIVAERDGHDFIESALANGAEAYLTSRGDRTPQAIADQSQSQSQSGRSMDASVIVVPDTMVALVAIGQEARSRLPEPVIGVTGSVGKTTVKDLIAGACNPSVSTHANKASFNNELGLPLTLANAPDGTRVTVLEMGSRGGGHITDLCAIGRPTIGVVTRVAAAHTELFGSLAGVAAAKGELIEALPERGVAVLNADDPLVLAMADRAACPVVTFGATSGDFRATRIELDDHLRPRFILESPLGPRTVKLMIAGEHMAINAVAALAAAVAAGVDLDDAVAGMQTTTISGLRMQVTQPRGGLTLINDAYNANPTSMRAALAALLSLPVERRIAIVGVMAELGDGGDAEHRRIAEEARDSGIQVVAVAASAYGPAAHHVSGIDAAQLLLGSIMDDTETGVLVKGSRVAELERIAAWLEEIEG